MLSGYVAFTVHIGDRTLIPLWILLTAGSGSDIEMVYKYDEKLADTGAYDVKSWKITPDEHMFDIDSKHRKRPKKKLLGIQLLTEVYLFIVSYPILII